MAYGNAHHAGISAIDIVLWDIKGKYYNVPVYQMLGRERLSWFLGVPLATCLCGLWLVLDVHSSNIQLSGVVIGVCAAIAYALYALCGSVAGKGVATQLCG